MTAGLLAENPCTPEILGEEVLARRKAGPHREQPVFTREEREKLLAVCEEELWGNLIRFAFATGLPQGEVLALRKEDADLAASRLTVRNRVAHIADEQSKERKTRLALLERRAGVPGLTFSAIRETAIRQALEDGGTDAEVMERFHCKDRQAFLRRYRQK